MLVRDTKEWGRVDHAEAAPVPAPLPIPAITARRVRFDAATVDIGECDGLSRFVNDALRNYAVRHANRFLCIIPLGEQLDS